MKKVYIYLSVFLFSVFLLETGLNIYKNISVKEGIDDCMQTYVNHLISGKEGGFFYESPYNSFHIDTEMIPGWEILDTPKGCYIWNGQRPFLSLVNSYYCFITYQYLKIGEKF